MNDSSLLKSVAAEFQAHPLLHSAHIGITTEDSVVILSGFVDCISLKALAERIALNVEGVKALANEIETSVDQTWRSVDCRIAKKVCNLIEWNGLIIDQPRISVERGSLSIFGMVQSQDIWDSIGKVLGEFSGASTIENHLKINFTPKDSTRQGS